MRLHWMTSVMLLATTAREATESIRIAQFLRDLSDHSTSFGSSSQADAYVWPWVLHVSSQIIAGFAFAAMIEFLARSLAALRAERLSGAVG